MNLEDQIRNLTALVDRQNKQIEWLRNRVNDLEKENKELRVRLNQDSHNSSKPPSSDSIFRKSERPSRKNKNKRKPGGQSGHKGNKMTKFAIADFKQDHQLECCPCCQSKDIEVVKMLCKQVLDIPIPKIEVTEHQLYEYQCQKCGQQIRNPLANELKQEVQYGPNIKSLVNYLSVYQLIPYKRLTELIEVMCGHKISQGSISNFNKELSVKLTSFMAQLKTVFTNPDQVIHVDETGCMVSKVLHWMHVYSTKTKTLLQGHNKRGKQAMDHIGILDKAQGTVIHDRFCSYNSYNQLAHGLCNAHLIRELKSIEENQQLKWSTDIKKLLLRAKDFKDNNQLSKARAKRLQDKYEALLREQRPYYKKIEKQLKGKQSKRGRTKRSTDHNLFNALWKYRTQILKFMYNANVPFDNNQAERDLRMLKVKMKVSNQFKTDTWMNVHATIRSFISTAQKQNRNIIDCILQVHQNPVFASQLGV